MGKRLKDVYPHASKFQVFKYKTGIIAAKTLKMALVATFLAGAGYGVFKAGQASPELTYAREQVVVDNLPKKVEQLKSEILADLKKCESQGHTEDDAIIIMDTNNKLSYGLYMFQRDTVTHYYKTLYQKDITKKEAVEIALDEQKAEQLARDILFTVGARDWYNCSKKHNLESRILLIKKLEN